MVYDVIVVGSGPSAIAALRHLKKLNCLVLDVGIQGLKRELPPEILYKTRLEGGDLSDFLLGENLESLRILGGEAVSLKLKPPNLRFVTQLPRSSLSVLGNFDAVQSFARGGLSNAWGAGALRFNQSDLEGFSFSAQDLEPHYDNLTQNIGINGADDLMAQKLGSCSGLQPPLPPSRMASWVMTRVLRNQNNGRDFYLGRTRSAILSHDLGFRKKHDVWGREYFEGNLPGIFHSGYGLDELISDPANKFRYQDGVLVKAFREYDGKVEVSYEDLSNGQINTVHGLRLVLAAGAIGSARIVLNSFSDFESRLPILDNAVTFLPFFVPDMLGKPLDVESYSGGELLMCLKDKALDKDVYASIYGLNGPLRTDLLRELPLDMQSKFFFLRTLIPGMGMIQVFYPDCPDIERNHLCLASSGSVRINYNKQMRGSAEGQIAKIFRGMGAICFRQLGRKMPPGSSIHYAGTLPISDDQSLRYRCSEEGRLLCSSSVYVADGSLFPVLPSKNLSFTLMAQASRLAERWAKSWKSDGI